MATLKVFGQIGSPQGRAELNDQTWPCALGKNGVIAAAAKREGDACTPLGTYQLLYGLYRPDIFTKPTLATFLWLTMQPDMGWCDAPTDPAYNTLVPLNYLASHERLYELYTRFIVLSHNLPATPGLGSAVFIHDVTDLARGTGGCIGFAPADLDAILALGVQVIEISQQ